MKTLNNPIETVRALDAGDVVNKDTLIQSFGRRYRRYRTAVYSVKWTHNSVILTSSRSTGNYSYFSVVCALTFHSHGDDKFLPGCTLATVTFPGFSFALSAAAACFGHLWQTRTCTVLFHSVRYSGEWCDRVGLPQTAQEGRGISKEQIENARTSITYRVVGCCVRAHVNVRKRRSRIRGEKTPFPMFNTDIFNYSRISGYECRHLWQT